MRTAILVDYGHENHLKPDSGIPSDSFRSDTALVGLSFVLTIIVLSLVPGIDRPHTGLLGEAEHFIAYCSTGTVFALVFWSIGSRVVIALGLTLLAGSMEILQMWVPGRHPAVADAIVSRMGGLLGIGLGALLLGLAAQMHKRRDHPSASTETLPQFWES